MAQTNNIIVTDYIILAARREQYTMGMFRTTLLVMLLAGTLGAQSTPYVFGFLRAHPERAEIAAVEAQKIQAAHIAHLDKMAADGVLVGAGPLLDSLDLRGVLIFKGITVEQARAAASRDPAVIGKRLRVDVTGWPGPKGIGDKINALLKNPDAKYTMTRHGLVVYRKTAASPKDLRTSTKPEIREMFAGHGAFYQQEVQSGRLLAAGPFDEDHPEFHGVRIYKSTDVAELRKWVAADPMVQGGYAEPLVLVWMVADGVMP
jgi:uncharacterized protein YciI